MTTCSKTEKKQWKLFKSTKMMSMKLMLSWIIHFKVVTPSPIHPLLGYEWMYVFVSYWYTCGVKLTMVYFVSTEDDTDNDDQKDRKSRQYQRGGTLHVRGQPSSLLITIGWCCYTSVQVLLSSLLVFSLLLILTAFLLLLLLSTSSEALLFVRIFYRSQIVVMCVCALVSTVQL